MLDDDEKRARAKALGDARRREAREAGRSLEQTTVNLTDDEIATIKALIDDWGWDYGLKADRSKVVALARKLGLDDWAKANDLDGD